MRFWFEEPSEEFSIPVVRLYSKDVEPGNALNGMVRNGVRPSRVELVREDLQKLLEQDDDRKLRAYLKTMYLALK